MTSPTTDCVSSVCFLSMCLCCVLTQDQVDTLTFQNQCLRDKAKRFEDALRRSTDEQIVVSLNPGKPKIISIQAQK